MYYLDQLDQAYSYNGWYVVNNAWNSNNLVFGTDYWLNSQYDPYHLNANTTLSWLYPNSYSGSSPKILAYPEIIFGPAPLSGGGKATDITGVFPIKVSDLRGIRADFDVTASGNTAGFNIAYDIWFTSVPNGDRSTFTNEVMVWLHKGAVPTHGVYIGTYQDATFSGKIYYDAAKDYTVIVADQDIMSGVVDFGAMFARLQSAGIISDQEYLASVELGSEIIYGAGSLTINHLNLEVDTLSSAGAVVTTYVDASGVTPGDPTLAQSLAAGVCDMTMQSIYTVGHGNALGNRITGNTLDNLIDGGAGNDVLDGGAGSDTLDGGLGNDTFVIDSSGDIVIEKSGEGTDTVLTDISFALSTQQEVENIQAYHTSWTNALTLTGNGLNNYMLGNAGNNVLDGAGGNDILSGGDGNDALSGGAGDDLLDGGVGNDTMNGGAGNDSYVVDAAGDAVTEAAGGGVDTVLTDISYALAAGQEIEYLQTRTQGATAGITLSGNEFDNYITGNSGDNIIKGLGGDDTINGGQGNDSAYGGTGDDTFIVGSPGDKVFELLGEGQDTVLTDNGYALLAGQEIENIQAYHANWVVTMTLRGNEFDNFVGGNDGDNILDGGAGNDTLNGRGGNDLMSGGSGNDSFVVDSVGDQVLESIGGGYDTVLAETSYSLAAGQEVEKLQARDPAGIKGMTLAGNEFANILTGNDGWNTLHGAAGNDMLYGMAGDDRLIGDTGNDMLDGGAGNDAMLGGVGSDTYIVDLASDLVYENAGEGADTVLADTTYALQSGQEIEFLQVRNAYSTTWVGLTGNEFDNYITGSAGRNMLSGKAGNDTLDGGAGDDDLYGGTGNDTYIVDSAGDRTTEKVGEGKDVVLADVDYSLRAGQEIENIQAYHASWTSAIDLAGNEFANFVGGNAGVNTLSGGGGNDALNGRGGNDILIGGAGVDQLVGGTGADRFVFADGDLNGNVWYHEIVSDFSLAEGDQIDLSLIDANALVGGDQSFTLETSSASGHAGAMWLTGSGSGTVVNLDLDGNGQADYVLELKNISASSLQSGDFIL